MAENESKSTGGKRSTLYALAASPCVACPVNTETHNSYFSLGGRCRFAFREEPARSRCSPWNSTPATTSQPLRHAAKLWADLPARFRSKSQTHSNHRKSNEIPAAQAPLGLFDLAGVVVTVDAMHTQSVTAKQITNAGGDYVFTVKGNHPTLYRACKTLPWTDLPAHTVTTPGHGRRGTRSIRVVTAPAWVEFAGATKIAQLRRTVTSNGKRRVEVVYLITSADQRAAPPATLAAWVQGHWGIENKLHWVRDETFDEDRSQVRTSDSPQVMATLRSTAISLLSTNRHREHRPRPTTPRPRPRNRPQTPTDLLKHDLAGALAFFRTSEAVLV